MKKLITYIVVFLFIPFLSVGAKNFWRGEIMKIEQVCKRWGRQPFDLKKFKVATNPALRAKMTCSLLREQKKFIGKDRSQIRSLFGDHDGFYFSDMFPAYMIEVGKKKGEESWQVVFMLSRNRKISEVMVHKNCCDDR